MSLADANGWTRRFLPTFEHSYVTAERNPNNNVKEIGIKQDTWSDLDSIRLLLEGRSVVEVRALRAGYWAGQIQSLEEATPKPHTHTGGMDRRVRELEEGEIGKALERNLGSHRQTNKEGDRAYQRLSFLL